MTPDPIDPSQATPAPGHTGGGGGGGGGVSGGDPSNTPPQTSQTGAGAGRFTTGGEDWLEWTAAVQWGPRWAENRAKLLQARESAARAGGPGHDPLNLVQFSDRQLLVGPGGGRLGMSTKGPYMAFRFDCEGMTWLVADREEPHKVLPSVLVRITGLACLMSGAWQLWQRARELIHLMGGTIQTERLSRVDMCLDMPGQDMEPFILAYHERRYITRAKGRAHYENGGHTIKIGLAAPSLRIYDKLGELIAKRDEVKRALMAWHRWGGVEPHAAIRVEFELGREALTRRGIDSVEDYFTRRADLIDHLCTCWVRFTRDVPDRTHTSRAVTLPLWDEVREGFLAWAGQPAGAALEPMPREMCDVDQLVRSIIGLALSAAARQGVKLKTEGALLNFITQRVAAQLAKVDWRSRLQKKLTALPSLH